VGTFGVIYPNPAQRMTAGTSIRHSPHRGRRAPPRRGRAQRGPDLGDARRPGPGNPL